MKEIVSPKPEITQFSPAKKMVLKNSEIVDTTMGVPERYVKYIADSIEKALEQMNINPDDILLSGYSGQDGAEREKVSNVVGHLQGELKVVARRAMQMEDEGVFDSNPEKKALLQSEIAQIKENLKNPLPQYFFTDIDGLGDDLNPINYAALGGRPTIGIYDKAKLLELTPDADQGGMFVVAANFDQIRQAQIAEVYPYYVDELDLPID